MTTNYRIKKSFVNRLFAKVFRLLKVLIFVIKNEIKISQFISWKAASFVMPAPHFIKQYVVMRNIIHGSTIIETGTHTGDTSKLLSSASDKVFTIEPDKILYNKAKIRFISNKNIEVLNGTSEEIFPTLLPKIFGDVSFWLDGHFSGEGTFKGISDSPIVNELSEIQKNMKNFKRICILIDDVRCFNPKIPEYADYPSIEFLISWSTGNNFSWSIENDIFIAKNY
jgi:hypothetical protein